jgi:DNA-binding CsgD family transcriptional regulator
MSRDESSIPDGAQLKMSWTESLDTLLQATGATGGSLQLFDDTRGYATRLLLRTRGDHDRVLEEYREEHMINDPQRAVFMRPGFVGSFTDASFTSAAATTDASYLKWQRQRCQVERFATFARRVGPEERTIISLHYAPGHGALSSGRRSALGALLPRFTAAVAEELRAEKILLQGFWSGRSSHEDRCTACVDDWGGVLFASESFARLIDQDELISTRNGRLFLRSERADRHYREALFDNWRGKSVSRVTPLRPPYEGRSVYLQMDSLPLTAKAVFGASPGLLLDVVDPAQSSRRLSLRAKAAFGLTPRESQLANALLAGHSIESAAHLLHISVATARVHLTNLSRKLGVGRQVDVIRVLSAW